MAKLKYDAIGLIAKGARALARDDDGGAAYALFELANNLRLVMRKEAKAPNSTSQEHTI